MCSFFLSLLWRGLHFQKGVVIREDEELWVVFAAHLRLVT